MEMFEDFLVLKLVRNEKIPSSSCDAGSQVELMELPCIAHVLGEDHGSLGPTLDSQHFDYVVVTSPEVRERGSSDTATMLRLSAACAAS